MAAEFLYTMDVSPVNLCDALLVFLPIDLSTGYPRSRIASEFSYQCMPCPERVSCKCGALM